MSLGFVVHSAGLHVHVHERLENSDIITALALLSIGNEERRIRLEERKLDDDLRARQNQQEQERRESEIDQLRLQSAENGQM